MFLASALGFSLSTITALAAIDPGYYCRPGQKCWPTSDEWQQLNQTMKGHLYATIPLGAPCYVNSTFYDPGSCVTVEENFNSSIIRGDTYGQTYWQNWEACGDSGCSLLQTNPGDTLYSSCSLGRLAAYYVDVRDPSHISATLQFAHAHNIRISIKNTGHDFFGRSAVPNSLAIWTHNLNHLTFYPNFTASNCPSANGQNIGEMGAGVIAGDAYHFFNEHGMDVTGGYEQSVGIAGGFGQGGGLGDFTTTYGLMVDTAVEFEVVTADGQIRTINECNEPDLFWAMRGGGGGTFAVLTKYRLQVFPSLPIHTFNFVAKFTGSNSSRRQALRKVLTAHAQSQVEWSSQKVTGSADYAPDGVEMGVLMPYNDDGTNLKAATASFVALVSNISDVIVLQNNYTSYVNYVNYTVFSIADTSSTEPPGIFSLLSSRLLQRQLFSQPETIERLVSAVILGIEEGASLLDGVGRTATQVVYESPVSNPDTDRQTSALPAWRDALWHVINVGEWEAPLSPSVLEEATTGFLDMLEPLKDLTPGGGAYLNEAHYGEPKWEEIFWGDNYARLSEVKWRYDPTHIFDCWKCVGWRGEQDPFYSCYQKW